MSAFRCHRKGTTVSMPQCFKGFSNCLLCVPSIVGRFRFRFQFQLFRCLLVPVALISGVHREFRCASRGGFSSRYSVSVSVVSEDNRRFVASRDYRRVRVPSQCIENFRRVRLPPQCIEDCRRAFRETQRDIEDARISLNQSCCYHEGQADRSRLNWLVG